MLDWKTRKVWMLSLMGYCSLVGLFQLFTNSSELRYAKNIWSITHLALGHMVAAITIMFGGGALIALIAAIFTLFKKERVKAVYIVWTIGVKILSIPTLLGHPK